MSFYFQYNFGGVKMNYQEFGFNSCTGEELFARSWESTDEAQINIVLVHGLGEHSGRYRDLAEYLLTCGFNIYAFDYLGFGRSSGKRGVIDSFETYFQDINNFIQLINKKSSKQKITILLGHSLGGLLGLGYGIKYPKTVDSIVISSPALKTYPIPPVLEKILDLTYQLLPQNFLNRVTLKNRLDITKLSHDEKIILKYHEDPLVHNRISPHFVKEIDYWIEYVIRNAGKFADPLLLMYAGADKIVDPTGVNEFVQNLNPELTKEIICFDDLYHEIFNEPENQLVLNSLVNWVQKVTVR